MKYASGSLKVENGGQFGWWIQSTAGYGPVATVRDEEAARLFAASPDLLEALRGFMEYYEAYNPITDKRIEPYAKEAKAAIAKALNQPL